MANEQAGIAQLRTTWRTSAQHATEQVARFVRLTILAAIPSIVNLLQGGKFDWRTLLAFVLPFAEVAYRQVWPALDATKATNLAEQDSSAEIPPETSPSPTVTGPDGLN